MEKAYIDTHKRQDSAWQATVVTSQDYHEGGPFAHSYRSPATPTKAGAHAVAVEWIEQNGFVLVDARAI